MCIHKKSTIRPISLSPTLYLEVSKGSVHEVTAGRDTQALHDQVVLGQNYALKDQSTCTIANASPPPLLNEILPCGLLLIG